MNKTTLMMAFAALAFASCSQDEPLSINEGRAIDFRPAIGGRATEITNANLSSINVTALLGDVNFFTDQTFAKDGEFFTSTHDYYWPGDDSEILFYAYSPAEPGGTIEIDKDVKTMTDFSVAPQIAEQIDFITATSSGKKSTNEAEGVELTFSHQLSQIEIQGKTENDNYTFKVTGVRIGQPLSKGTFNFATEEWTPATDRAIYEVTYDDAITLGSQPQTLMATVSSVSDNAMLLPQQLTAWDPVNDASNQAEGAYLSVKLQIILNESGAQIYPFPSDANCVWASIPIDDNWEAGKKYVYTLDFTHGAGYVDPHDPQPGKPVLGGPIKFDVEVTNWVDQNINEDMTTSTDTTK
ncbi:MAG: fimbrillin family protein [Muribaculaceae bacterium]|nr:fimbrillin family protein [Muribaculaceae bacterium]